MLGASIYAAAAICEAAELDPGAPPIQLAGYEGIAELERRLLLERAVLAMRQGVRIRDPHRSTFAES